MDHHERKTPGRGSGQFYATSRTSDSITDWFIKRFSELCSDETSVVDREEILHRVFIQLEQCDPGWSLQLELLDLFASLLHRKPQVIGGIRNLVDLIISLVDTLENKAISASKNEQDTEKRMTAALCKLFHLIQLVGRTNLTVKNLNRLLSILRRAVEHRVRPVLCSLLLTAIKDMAINPSDVIIQGGTAPGQPPRAAFEFNGQSSCLEIPMDSHETGWPCPKGYTFCAWLRWSNDSDSNPQIQYRCIYRMLSAIGHGIELRLSRAGVLIVRSISRTKRQEFAVNDAPLVPKRWYFVAMSHSRTQSFSRSSGNCRISVDGYNVFKNPLQYPQITSTVEHCAIGAKPFVGSNKTGSFFGQMSAIYFFTEPLSDQHIQILYSRGGNFMIQPIWNNRNSHWLKSFVSSSFSQITNLGSNIFNHISTKLGGASPRITDQHSVFDNLLFSYHPLSIEDDLCLNTSPVINSSRKKSNNQTNMHAFVDDTRVTVIRDVRDTIHCGVGGILVLIPLFSYLDKLWEGQYRQSSGLIALVFETLSQLLVNSASNQRTMLQCNGFAIIGYLLTQASPLHLTEHVVIAISSLCSYASWMDNLLPVNPDDASLRSRSTSPTRSRRKSQSRENTYFTSEDAPPLPQSVFSTPNQHLDLQLANYRTLFNDCFIHLVLNFKLWRRKDVSLNVQQSIIETATTYVNDQPAYFRKFISVGALLDDVRRYYRYISRTIGDGDRDTRSSTWKFRQAWLKIVTTLICRGAGKEIVEFEDIEVIVQMTSECSSSLDCSELLELLTSLLNHIEVKIATATYNHLQKLGGPDLFVSILQDQIAAHDHVKIAVLHIIAAILKHDKDPKPPKKKAVDVTVSYTPDYCDSLFAAVAQALHIYPLSQATYLAFLELAMKLPPGSIGPTHASEYDIKHEKSRKDYQDGIFTKIGYPQVLCHLSFLTTSSFMSVDGHSSAPVSPRPKQLPRKRSKDDSDLESLSVESLIPAPMPIAEDAIVANSPQSSPIPQRKRSQGQEPGSQNGRRNSKRERKKRPKVLPRNVRTHVDLDEVKVRDDHFGDVHGVLPSEREGVVTPKQMLRDLVIILDAGEYNCAKMLEQLNWQNAVVHLVDWDISAPKRFDDRESKSDPALDIIALLLHHTLVYDDDGWKIFDETFLYLRRSADNRLIQPESYHAVRRKLYLNIFRRLAHTVAQGSAKHRYYLSKNICHVVDSFEQAVFDTEISGRASKSMSPVCSESDLSNFSPQSHYPVSVSNSPEFPRNHHQQQLQHEQRYQQHQHIPVGSPSQSSQFYSPGSTQSSNGSQFAQPQSQSQSQSQWVICDDEEFSNILDELPIIFAFLDLVEHFELSLIPPTRLELDGVLLLAGNPARFIIHTILRCVERTREDPDRCVNILQRILDVFNALMKEDEAVDVESFGKTVAVDLESSKKPPLEWYNKFLLFTIDQLRLVKQKCDEFASTPAWLHTSPALGKCIKKLAENKQMHVNIPVSTFEHCDGEDTVTLVNSADLKKLVHSLSTSGFSHIRVPMIINDTVNLQIHHSFTIDNIVVSVRVYEACVEYVKNTTAHISGLGNQSQDSYGSQARKSREILERVRVVSSTLVQSSQTLMNKSLENYRALGHKEVNRRVLSDATANEKEELGAVAWNEVKKSLYEEGSVWVDGKAKKKRKYYSIDKTENRSRMRRKLKQYHGGTDHIIAPSHHDLKGRGEEKKQMQEDEESIKLLKKLKIGGDFNFADEDEDDPALQTQEYDEDNAKDEEEDGDEWDYCEEGQDALLSQHGHKYSFACNLVLPVCVIEGSLEVHSSFLKFTCQQARNTFENSLRRKRAAANSPNTGERIRYTLPALDDLRLKEHVTREWRLRNIQAIYRRRYQLQRTAVEIFLSAGRNYFLDFGTKEARSTALRTLVHLKMPLFSPLSCRPPLEVVKRWTLTTKWQNWEISNFEYLMQLNTISGRTYNDLNQYPVFPWVLQDFVSSVLDLSNPDVYRDLSKPLGAINPARLDQILQRFEMVGNDDSIPPFHYGSHYSNAGIVLSYLLRLEPFASLHLELQDGKFDYPDRLFQSIASLWSVCTTSLSSFKELIPEFYYNPEFLSNLNKYNLGHKQDGSLVHNVILPPWANSPEEFVRLNREALESEYVSERIHHWIDLVFGYKQKGKRALDAHNLFFYLTYEGAVDFDKMEDPVLTEAIKEQITHFGQTPLQLFRHAHPTKNLRPANLQPLIQDSFTQPLQQLYIDFLHHASVFDEKPVIAFVLLGECFITINSKFEVSGHQFSQQIPTLQQHQVCDQQGHHPDSDIPHPFTFLPNVYNSANHPAAVPKSLTTVFSNDGRYLYLGNNWDFSLRVYSIETKKEIRWHLRQSLVRHKNRITCIDLADDILATGSIDCTVLLWEIENGKVVETPKHVLRGHPDPIKCVAINADLDICVSASSSGVCLMHTLRTGKFVRTLELPSDGMISAGVPHLISISSEGYIIMFSQGTSILFSCNINGMRWKKLAANETLSSLVVSNDGHLILTAGHRGEVLIRRIHDLKILCRFAPLKDSVTYANFSADQKYVFVGTSSGNICIHSPVLPDDVEEKLSSIERLERYDL